MYDPEPKFQPKVQPRVQPKVTVPSYIGESGQVANWLSYSGAGDKLYDFSGKENHGSFYGGVSWLDGSWGWCLDFNGADGTYVQVPWDASLDIINEFTAEAWCRWDVLPSTKGAMEHILSQEDGAGTGRSWIVGDTDDHLVSWLGGTEFDSGYVISADEWVLVHLTYDGSDLAFYVNASFQNSVTKDTDEGATGDYVMAAHKTKDRVIDGNIALMKMYSRVLTNDEMDRHFESTRAIFGI